MDKIKKVVQITIFIFVFDFCFSLFSNSSEKLIFLKGPYLQNVRKDGITIMWETNIPADSVVNYGRININENKIEDKALKTIHEVTINNLEEERVYIYRVSSKGVSSKEYKFKTAIKKDTPFRFVVWGDNRTDVISHTWVANGIAKAKPDIAINVGDVVTRGNEYEQWSREYFKPISCFAHSVPTYIAIGNHEQNAEWYYKFVSQPGNESWYSFNYGNARFIILDTNKDYSIGSEQYNWLKADLNSKEARDAKWRFVFFHHPAYSEGWDEPGYDGEAFVRSFLLPLFEKNKVDIIFNGHTHDYERGYLNGVYHIITGGGGAGLDSFQQDFPHITVYKSVYHFCQIDINGGNLVLKAITPQGEVIDSFEINK